MRRASVVLLVAAFALLGLAQPALAHNTLTGSNPADGASIADAPAEVTLTFDDDVQPGEGNQISVVGPDKTLWADGEVSIDGTKARVGLAPLGPEGRYTIAYRILSADGHPVTGKVGFTLTQAGDGQPVGRVESGGESGQGGVPLWVWIAGAGVLLAVGLVLALRMGREQE